MGTQTVKRELNRPAEVFIDGGFLFVRKRNHFIQEGEVAGFTDVFVYGREEPERIIRTIGGMAGLLYITFILRGIFMSGVMREFDKRESAAVMNLRRQHEAQLFLCGCRIKMNDALNILHGITVAVAVAQTAVDKGCRT